MSQVSDDDGDEKDVSETALCTVSTKPVSKIFELGVGASMSFLVEFTPHITGKIAAEIRITVVDNPFEDNVIQLVGQGYKQSVTIDNIHCHDSTQTMQRAISAIEFDGDEVISKFRNS